MKEALRIQHRFVADPVFAKIERGFLKPKPEAAVVAWFFSSDWCLPVPVIAEIQEGAEASPRRFCSCRVSGE
jgi:hypothetical protein